MNYEKPAGYCYPSRHGIPLRTCSGWKIFTNKPSACKHWKRMGVNCALHECTAHPDAVCDFHDPVAGTKEHEVLMQFLVTQNGLSNDS